jgi:hypothetical protein
MGRVVRLREAQPAVSLADLYAGVAIVAAFVVFLAVCLSTLAPHRTKLTVRGDFGLSLISDVRR